MQISGIAEGSGKGRIPWARIKAAQGDFILPQYLPNGITLTQYHHIRVNDANALLQHWTQRQAAGEIPFRFKNNFKDNRPILRASEDGDASTSAVSRDQLERGPQNDQEDSCNVSLAPVSWLQQTLTTFYGQSSLPLTILASEGL
jgi:hypothetical protein